MLIYSVDIPLWWILATVIFVWYLFSPNKNLAYWRSVGVRTRGWLSPITGPFRMMRRGMVTLDLENRKLMGKTIGGQMGGKLLLQTCDLDLLKEIYVKQFSNFHNRNNVMNEPPSRSMLLNVADEQWKKIRSILSPTFSSGKLKRMTSKISTCADNMCKHLNQLAEKNDDVDIKDVTGAYTMDVIASTAFGIDLDSQNDPESPFVKHAKRSFNFSLSNPILLFFIFFPWLSGLLNRLGLLQLFPKKSVDFFTGVVDKVMKDRQSSDKHDLESDFLQLMIRAGEKQQDASEDIDEELRSEHLDIKSNTKGLSHEEILANGMIFFLAGYETTATALSFMIYSLAVNPDVQDNVIQEIDEVAAGKDTSDFSLYAKMPYLDMCVNETLRMYPPVTRSQRTASRDCDLCGIPIKKNTLIDMPSFPLHYDEEAWPNPETFIPERFTAEAKAERNPFQFAPFGQGPRNCIGMRLALLEVKVAIVQILTRFKIAKCDKTLVPMSFSNNSLLTPAVPIKVTFQSRETKV